MSLKKNDRVFVLGASGNVGSSVISGLIIQGIETTAYVRNRTKATQLFTNEIATGLLSIIVGTYESIEIYRNAIRGHDRLFMLIIGDVNKPTSMSYIKETFAKIAFEEGVKQIVDISSYNVRTDGIQGIIGYMHKTSEDKLYALADQNPDKRSLVILRPGAFMSNHFTEDIEYLKSKKKLVSCGPPSSVTTWIDTKGTNN